MKNSMIIENKNYTLDEIFKLLLEKPNVRLSKEVMNNINKSHKTVKDVLKSSKIVYGINTGFGKLSQIIIPKDQLVQLQENLLVSHSVGVGSPIDDNIVWTMIFIKILSLCKGFSGVSGNLVKELTSLLNSGYLPIVPSKGSVGASGDLAPLAHMALPLLSLGEVRKGNKVFPSKIIFKNKYKLQPKEGLAIINGTQFSTSLAINALFKIKNLIKIADIISSLTIEGLMGTDAAFRKDVQRVKQHIGQLDVAKNLSFLLKNSEIHNSHKNCNRVQDMYSLRCIPQVHGASREILSNIFNIVENELNSVSDNPIVLADSNDIVSSGHFHAEIIGQAMDSAAIAISSYATISERRIYSLIDGKFGLPPFLIEKAGINSGFMMFQVTAAALVSENKTLAYPGSVDSIPTCGGQEDHVSMAPWCGRKLLKIIDNVETVLSIELILATQALILRRGINPGKELIPLFNYLKKNLKELKNDRLMNKELFFSKELINSGKILNYVSDKLN